MKALSILQPWAFLIVRPDVTHPAERARLRSIAAIKDVENRTWPTRERGEVYVHAGKGFDTEGFMGLVNHWYRIGMPGGVGDVLGKLQRDPKLMQRGGIIGTMTIAACCREIQSPWKAEGCFGYGLVDSRPLPFRPLSGQLKFFEVPD